MIRHAFAAALFIAVCLPTSLTAAETTVKGVHLCCGGCVKGVDAALKGVAGVTNVACDRETMTVTFDSQKKGDAEAAVNALAAGGFYGTATFGSEAVPFPDAGAKNAKGNSVTVTGVHLCCGRCVKDAEEALTSVDGIASSNIEIDRAARTITVKKDGLDAAKVIGALNDAGFYGKVK